MALLVAPFKGDTEDPALILACYVARPLNLLKFGVVLLVFPGGYVGRARASRDGIYRNFFVNSQTPVPHSASRWMEGVKSFEIQEEGSFFILSPDISIFLTSIRWIYRDKTHKTGDLRGNFFTRVQVMNVFAPDFFSLRGTIDRSFVAFLNRRNGVYPENSVGRVRSGLAIGF